MNLYDMFMAPLEKRFLNTLRKKLIPKATGDVLEIGAGTGVNFKYYDFDLVSKFNALDIDVSELARKRAPKNATFINSDEKVLPYKDESFDTVVETLVLCSVDEAKDMMLEIKRVLKPDGKFIHIDHGLPTDDKLKKLFLWLAPAWRGMTRSCRIDKDQKAIIESAGFNDIEQGTKAKGVFYWGVAKKTD